MMLVFVALLCFSDGAQLQTVCQLAVMFIRNVNVSGYSVTANVHSKVDALLVLTSQHALTLLWHKCIELVNSYMMFVIATAVSVLITTYQRLLCAV